jgi:hypothetical protein
LAPRSPRIVSSVMLSALYMAGLGPAPGEEKVDWVVWRV